MPLESPIQNRQLMLLKKVVAAKCRYWNALSELEHAITPDGEDFSDAANDKVIEEIDALAAGLPLGEDTSLVTEAALARVIKLAEL